MTRHLRQNAVGDLHAGLVVAHAIREPAVCTGCIHNHASCQHSAIVTGHAARGLAVLKGAALSLAHGGFQEVDLRGCAPAHGHFLELLAVHSRVVPVYSKTIVRINTTTALATEKGVCVLPAVVEALIQPEIELIFKSLPLCDPHSIIVRPGLINCLVHDCDFCIVLFSQLPRQHCACGPATNDEHIGVNLGITTRIHRG
mmetsp:Transcript_16418/g.44280  ORF Transcript_16418/g.44280 Transcript_16418/m.44280 type:complete len:200 (-) Transcript_16418:114-713(-)